MTTTRDDLLSAQMPAHAFAARVVRPGLILLFLGCLARFLAASAYRAALSSTVFADFSVYHSAARRLLQHEHLYAADNQMSYVYSPLLALLLRPLARLPLEEAGHIWTLLCVALLIAAVAIFAHALQLRLREHGALVALLLLTAFRFWPTVIEFETANVTIPVFFLTSLLFLALRSERWKSFALVLAVGVLLKTWMLAFILLLLIRRRYRDLVLTMVAVAAGLVILFTIVGWNEFPPYLHVTRQFSHQEVMVAHSIYGISKLFFAPNLFLAPLVNSSFLLWTCRFFLYVPLFLSLAYLVKVGNRIPADDLPTVFALILVAFLLASTLSHQYYYMLALPLIWCTLANLWRMPRLANIYAACLAIAGYLLLASPSPGVLGPPISLPFSPNIGVSLHYGTTCFAGLLIYSAGLINIRSVLAAPPAPCAPPSLIQSLPF